MVLQKHYNASNIIYFAIKVLDSGHDIVQVSKDSDLDYESRDSGHNIAVTGDPDPESICEAKAVNPSSSELQIITRSGKIAGRNTKRNDNKGSGSNVAMKVKALYALHMEHLHEPTSLDVFSIPCESLTIEQAFTENKQAWEASILDELKSLKKNNTYRIIKLNTASNC
ncbi:hypothetical protein K3495_g10863 [Podosphaera aphanis]|nr:hypothetical protein K3495_g10863 [Podosphaera aphanis]